MNKVHSVIWSESLGAYVVAHEHAKAHGKLSSTRKALATAVALGIGSLLAPYALADSCPASGSNVLSTSSNETCSLGAGDSLTVLAPNGIIDTINTGVSINYGGAGSNTIINNHLIQGSSGGLYILNSTKVTGAVVNNTGALLDGGEGFGISLSDNSLLSAGITNAGTISANSAAGISLDASTLSGGITNSGIIEGYGKAIIANGSTITGGITNLFGGTLQLQNSRGIGIALTNTTLSGGINNAGTIHYGVETGTGILLNQSSLSGGIVNSGTITGGPSSGYGIRVTQASISGNISNSGNISGSANDGIELIGSTLTGNLINVAGGLIAGGNLGVDIENTTITGGVSNSGTISGASALGIKHSDVVGSVFNNGLITGVSDGLSVTASRVDGAIVNQGVIEAAQNSGLSAGVFIDSASVIANGITNSGTVIGGANGLFLRGSTISGQGLTNSGTITGRSSGLVVQGSNITGDLRNSGLIQNTAPDASGGAVVIGGTTLTGNIINTGSILGVVTSSTEIAQAAGIALFSATNLSGNISNSGTISASASGGTANKAFGIQLSSATMSGSIINSGNISASNIQAGVDEAYGIQLGGTTLGSSVAGGIVNFSGGVISANGVGTLAGIDINNSVLNGGITNSGLISAVGVDSSENTTVAALTLENGSTLNGGVTNTGQMTATLQNTSVSGQAFGLVVGSGTTLEGGVSNAGNLSAQILGAGLAVGLFVPGGNIDGDIVNYSSGVISASVGGNGEALGIALSGPLTGSIINNGLITGGNGGIFLGNSFVSGTITNHGLVSGAAGTGITLNTSSVRGGIINTGSIAGGTYGLALDTGTIGGGQLQLLRILIPVATGGITNSGNILGGVAGIFASNSQVNNDVVNSGIISGGQTGIHLLGASTITGTLNNSGAIRGGNGAGILVEGTSTISGLINSGTIAGAAGADAINVSSDSELDTLDITGDNSAKFIGSVIAAGATATVDSGATYTMDDGQLFQVATFNNLGSLGVVAAGTGGAAATATINGDYTQDSGATFRTYVNNDTTFGHLLVTGTATLPSAAKIDVDVSNPGFRFTASELDDVIKAGTLNSDGTFNVTTNSLLFDFGAVVKGNSVDLVITSNPTAIEQAVSASGNNRNAGGAARVLDNAIFNDPNSALGTYFGNATTQKALSNAVSQTLPLMSAATTFAAQSSLTSMNDIVQSRIENNNGMSSGGGFYGDSHVWMKPFGSWTDQDGRSNAAGYNANTYGMAFGLDGVLSDVSRVGLSFAYAKVDTNSDSNVARQSAKIDVYQLMGYGSYALAPDTEFNYHVGVGRNRTDGERLITLGGDPTKANSNYDSTTATAGVGLGKVFNINPTTRFIPSVRADYTWVQDDSYHEKGSSTIDPLLLSVHKNETDQLILGVDGKVTHEILPGTTLEGNLGVGYDVINDGAAINSSFAGAPGQTFTTKGINPSPWLGRGGVGIATKLGNGMEISVNYDGEVRSDYTNQTASIKLRVPF